MSILVTAIAAAVIVTPIVSIIALVHCGWKSLCWALVLSVAVAGAAWLSRGIKERDWRDKQQLHIRRAVENFGDQYNRISELDDTALRHDYVTNFCDNACILLNYDCKFAPNTSNLVERYYADWDKRIDRARCTRHVARATPTLEQRYGVAADVLFVMEDVKAGTVLTRDMLASGKPRRLPCDKFSSAPLRSFAESPAPTHGLLELRVPLVKEKKLARGIRVEYVVRGDYRQEFFVPRD